MGRKIKKVDVSARPPLKLNSHFTTDAFLMYHIQVTTKLPTSEILGFFADLGKTVAEEGVHYMHEQGTSSMYKKIFDFFPGTTIPFSLNVEGSIHRYYHNQHQEDPNVRTGSYRVDVGFPNEKSFVDQTQLANIIMEKALLGACDMPDFEKPDPKCPKMYKDLMKEVQSRRMV